MICDACVEANGVSGRAQSAGRGERERTEPGVMTPSYLTPDCMRILTRSVGDVRCADGTG